MNVVLTTELQGNHLAVMSEHSQVVSTGHFHVFSFLPTVCECSFTFLASCILLSWTEIWEKGGLS